MICFCQLSAQSDTAFSIRAFTGLNTSLFQYEKLNYSPATGYEVGLNLLFNPQRKLSYQIGLGAFNNRSRLNQLTQSNQGVSLSLSAHYSIDDFSLFGGAQYQMISNQRFQNSVNEVVPSVILDDLSNSNLAAYFGVELKLDYRLRMQLSSALSLQEKGPRIAQLGFLYAINKPKEKASYRRLKRQASKSQIQQLKDGVLLVRLKTLHKSIDALKKQGRPAKAARLKLRQAEENDAIMQAFKMNYDFSDLYFFYSQHSNKVKEGNWGTYFLDDKFEETVSFSPNKGQKVFTAELTNLEADTTKYFRHYRSRVAAPDSLRPLFYGSPDFNFEAFVIKDQSFIQLNKPFPYYQRMIMPSLKKHPEQLLIFGPIPLLFSKTTFLSALKKLNRRLHKFQRKTEEEQEQTNY